MKGYELAEGLDKGILSKEQRVSGAGYYYCTIGFVLKEVGNNFLFKDFEIIEEQQDIDIQSIEELDLESLNGLDGFTLTAIEEEAYGKVNKLVQAVKQLDKKMEEKNNGIK